MGTYTAAVQELYVAYFARPADVGGLAFWEDYMNKGGKISVIAAEFAKSTEYQQTYGGKSAYEVVAAVYANLFNREPDVAGLNFWAQNLMKGVFTVDQAVTTIAAGAQGADSVTFKNKVAAATAFTTNLDTVSEILGYAGTGAINAAKDWMAKVTDDASLAAAIAPDAINTAVGIVVDKGGVSGATVSLTAGVDTLVGTGANDKFVALQSGTAGLSTINALDSIDGGAGKDTLLVQADNTLNLTGSSLPTLNSIEVLELQGADSVTVNSTGITGLTNLNVTKVGSAKAVSATAAGSTDVSVKLAAAGAAVGVDGGKNVTVALTDVKGAADVITVGGTTAPTGTVTVTETGAAVVAGAAGVTLSAINVTGGASINVTQKAASDVAAVAGDTAAHSVTQGAINVTAGTTTSIVTVKQDASQFGYGATAAVAEKANTQEITFTAAKAGDTVTVTFTAGNSLTFTAKTDLTAAQVASAFANLVNGSVQGSASAQLGVYSNAGTGVTGFWASGAAQTVDSTHSKVVFSVEDETAVALTAAATGTATVSAAAMTVGTDEVDADPGVLSIVSGTVTVDAGTSVKTVSIDGYGATSAINNGSAVETINLSHSNFGYNGATGAANAAAGITIADTAATLALNLTGVGVSGATAAVSFTAAPTTLNVKSNGSNNISLTAAATEALNVSGTGKLTTTGDLTVLKTVKVTETAGLTLASSNADTITSVDTTGTTGSVSVSINGATATYAGGAGADTVAVLDAATAIAKSIDLGAGNDKLDLSKDSAAAAVNAVAVPTVELKGGEGTDTIVLTAAAAATLSGGVTFQDKISGFEKLSINAVAADATVNLDNVDDINYVINAGGAGKLTLDKMLANATVELTGAGNTIVQLADATGTADQVNFISSASGTIGTLTANGVETITFNVNDMDTSALGVSTATVVVASDAAKTITVAGAGNLVMTLDATSKSVATIDGSAATGRLTITTSDMDGTVVTTVKGGAGKDTLTASGSGDVLLGGAGNDTLKVVSTGNSAASAVTLTGGDGVDTFDVSLFKAANAGAAVTITDLAKGEVIKFASAASADFVSSKVTLIAEATFNDYVTEAAKAADIAANLAGGGAGTAGISWFQFNGNTFIVQDVDGDGAFTNGADIVVKLTGLIDLSGASFNDVTAGSLKYL